MDDKIKATGTVKWFNLEKGYGFIEDDFTKRDVFVHITNVRKSNLSTLNPGERFSYTSIDHRGRPTAAGLERLP